MDNFLLPTLDSLLDLFAKTKFQVFDGEDLGLQILAISIIFLTTFIAVRRYLSRQQIETRLPRRVHRHLKDPAQVEDILLPLANVAASVATAISFQLLELNFFYLKAYSLCAAIVFTLKVVRSFVGRGFLFSSIRLVLVLSFLLYIGGVLEDTTNILDSIGFQWKGKKISLFFAFKALCILTVLFASVTFIAGIIEKSISQIHGLDASMKIIMKKFSKVGIFTCAFFISLDVVGIDLTALTVFSGAVGIGIGFGLQKVFSNFISGIILLSDRSIKPGDVIGIENTYGWVNSLGARYVSIITRDGKEHLIPNELMITNKVENWSFSNTDVRVRIPLCIDYKTDVHRAIKLIEEVANDIPRVLNDPAAKCLVRKFGEYSIELELRIWIRDPASGMGSIQSEILIGVLDAFKIHKIKIPHPIYNIRYNNGSFPNHPEAGIDLAEPVATSTSPQPVLADRS